MLTPFKAPTVTRTQIPLAASMSLMLLREIAKKEQSLPKEESENNEEEENKEEEEEVKEGIQKEGAKTEGVKKEKRNGKNLMKWAEKSKIESLLQNTGGYKVNDEDFSCGNLDELRAKVRSTIALSSSAQTVHLSSSAQTVALSSSAQTVQDSISTFYDPMCGNGTLPMVFDVMRLRFMNAATSRLGGIRKIRIVGSDLLNTDGLVHARKVEKWGGEEIRKMHSRVEDNQDTNHNHYSLFLQRNRSPLEWLSEVSSNRLPFKDGSVDLLFVDPPWGQRHGKHSMVMKNFHLWLKEWIRIVRPNGYIGIVTIRTNQIDNEYRTYFHRFLECISVRNFNNCGYEHCKFFIFRKKEL